MTLDTYTAIEVNSYGHFYLKARTNVLRNTTQPNWNETFEIDLDASSMLRLICYKKTTPNGDVLLGKSQLNVSPEEQLVVGLDIFWSENKNLIVLQSNKLKRIIPTECWVLK